MNLKAISCQRAECTGYSRILLWAAWKGQQIIRNSQDPKYSIYLDSAIKPLVAFKVLLLVGEIIEPSNILPWTVLDAYNDLSI